MEIDHNNALLPKSQHYLPCCDEDMPRTQGVKLDCHMMYLIQENHKNFINSMLEMRIPQELQLNFNRPSPFGGFK